MLPPVFDVTADRNDVAVFHAAMRAVYLDNRPLAAMAHVAGHERAGRAAFDGWRWRP